MLTLACGAWSVGLCAEAGASLMFCRLGGEDILRPAINAAATRGDPRRAACFPCAPYFGRLPGGLRFAGRRWPLAPTLPACEPHCAIHGEAWLAPWRIERVAPREARLVCSGGGGERGRWPFPYAARQWARVDAGGFSLTLAVENRGGEPMPASPALHPYFPRPPDARLRFGFAALWRGPARSGETGRRMTAPARLGFADARPLPAEDVDVTFAGFGGECLIAGGGRRLRLISDAPHLHLYAPAGADYFCLEPTVGLPGARDWPILAPGATARLSMRIEAA